MSLDEILDGPALAQARLVRRGALRSTDLVRAYCDRIARIDARIHAFVSVSHIAAAAAARGHDLRRRVPLTTGLPFAGVPIGIKDVHFVRGTFTRYGSRAFRWLYTPFDDVDARRLRAGGFVLLGKLATSELGALPVTEPDIHPATRNPWDPTRTAGGSSGGSGAAVAAGLVPIALGSDGAGSIRIPSAFCGLFGFKPSRDAVPHPFSRIDRVGLITVGPIARTVDDASAMIDVLAGRAQRPVGRAPRALRIRFTTEGTLAPTDPELAARVADVARALASMGHRVEEGRAPAGTVDEFLPIYERQAAHVPIFFESQLQPVTRWLRARGRHVADEHVRAVHARLEAQVLDWFGDADLWVTPTTPTPAPPVGSTDGLDAEAAFRRVAPLGQFTAPFNLSGQPACSIPVGVTKQGLPIGVQLAARRGADAELLAVAKALEAEMPWRNLRAPIHG